MSAALMLEDLRRRGVRLEVVGDRLRVDAPSGALSPDELDRLRDVKADLLAALAESGAAWDDPTCRPLPTDADDWHRGMRASYGAILHLPPHGCLAPIACSRLGPCERHARGRSCEVA